tara:strand:- start:1769 stop:2170 length:402 start_codon:yes stop_codon:yes gene_type:complete
MPQVKYTTRKGLFQQGGRGFVNGFYHPGGSTTSAADSLAIPVTHSVVAKTTGDDAEALTIVDGTPGQMLTIYIATDGGGDGTLTAATNSTGTGWATIVFADEGDRAVLYWVDSTIGWIILSLSGVAGPPVSTV